MPTLAQLSNISSSNFIAITGLGPFIGTCIAVFFYKFIKMLEYEMANPGQDGDDKNDPTKNEEKKHEVQARSRSIFT